MNLIQLALLLVMCVASGAFSGHCFAQYAEPVETGPATAKDYETMHDYLKPKAQVVETLPWAEVQTNDFEHMGEGFIVDHLRNHPMLGDNLERMHEWLHQKIERLRPRDDRGAAYSTVFVEASDAEFAAWADRQAIEAAGWKVVRLPAGKRLVNVVAIGKTHFSHAGHLTVDALRRFVNQVENRQFKPVKNAKARFVTSITMYTRKNCRFCDQWRHSEAPKARSEGVSIVEETDLNDSVPWFVVYDSSGEAKRYYGFTSFEAMKRGIQ